ncbi:MAG: hypothetical protein IPP81_19055 [Chitinophagaceae bacterium]|nr:hypothetical protein [Chitinophagaceae bacterium]
MKTRFSRLILLLQLLLVSFFGVAQTVKSPTNDHWNNNIYTNSFYNFKVEFPKGWETDNGASQRTLARVFNREFGASFSVQVINLPAPFKNSNDIWKSLSKDDMLAVLKIETNNDMFKKVSNIKVSQGYLSSEHAYLVELIHEASSQQRTFTYLIKQIRCFKKGKQYQITFTLPVIYNTNDMQVIYNRVIDSFVFYVNPGN